MFEFLNSKIKSIYKGKLGHSIIKKELKKINQNQISNNGIDFTKKFSTKKLAIFLLMIFPINTQIFVLIIIRF